MKYVLKNKISEWMLKNPGKEPFISIKIFPWENKKIESTEFGKDDLKYVKDDQIIIKKEEFKTKVIKDVVAERDDIKYREKLETKIKSNIAPTNKPNKFYVKKQVDNKIKSKQKEDELILNDGFIWDDLGESRVDLHTDFKDMGTQTNPFSDVITGETFRYKASELKSNISLESGMINDKKAETIFVELCSTINNKISQVNPMTTSQSAIVTNYLLDEVKLDRVRDQNDSYLIMRNNEKCYRLYIGKLMEIQNGHLSYESDNQPFAIILDTPVFLLSWDFGVKASYTITSSRCYLNY